MGEHEGTSGRCENRAQELVGGAGKVRRLLALAEEPSEGSSSLLGKTSEMAWFAVTQLLAGGLRECLPCPGLAKTSPYGAFQLFEWPQCSSWLLPFVS